MFFEYAIEPDVLADPQNARYFLESCRPWKGRFLASYPRDWPQMVLARVTEVGRKALEVRLIAAKNAGAFLRTRSTYDEAQTWLWNAEAEHVRKAFRAIVASEDRGQPHILEASAVDDTQILWRSDAGQLVARDHSELTDLLQLLLRVSSHIAIIDPYFRADNPDKTAPLRAICAALPKATIPVEVHWSDEPAAMPSYGACMGHAQRVLPGILPNGLKVTMRCWHERVGGARIHNRYMLTDIAGVKFGDSIEDGPAGQQDHISILDEASRTSLWNQYVSAPGAFDSGGADRAFVGR